ncbi:MAG: winged helix-turn-helix domain-containing protein [Acidobacteria bacterium]|nr:winged helix-turn-helix domain-containing protein [Acidobacteriota bacterium]
MQKFIKTPVDIETTRFFEFADFRVDTQKRILLRGDERIALTPKVFETLLVFLEHRGEILEKNYLMNLLWQESFVEESNLTQNVAVLRRALGENSKENKFIVTVPGRGYKFVAEVCETSRTETRASNHSGEISETNAESDSRTVFETSEIKTPINAGQTQAAEDIVGIDTGQSAKSEKSARFRLAISVVLGVLVLGLLGYFLWPAKVATPAASAPIKTLAVLPFKPLVTGDRNEALELGMADALISELGGNEVRVSSLRAVRRFNSLDQDPIASGIQLGVDAVLEGSIQIADERVRVSARLIRVSDGQQLWAGQFNEKLTDIFAIQSSIAAKVASALKITLSRMRSPPTQSVEAYQLYMKGNLHMLRLVSPEVKKGIAFYEQAIAADPGYAMAFVGLTQAYRALALTNDAHPSDVMPKSAAAAQRAVELDPSLADAWTALAVIDFWYNFDPKAAERHQVKALGLDPKSPRSHFFYAHLLSNTGLHDEAIAEIKRAKELDPIDMATNALEGQILHFAGRDDEALKVLRSTAETFPSLWLPHLFMSRVYLKMEMYDEAIAAATKAGELSNGNAEASATIGLALARSGKTRQAREVLKELETRAKTRYVPLYDLAQVYNALGDRAKAIDLLEKAFNDREPLMTFLKVDSKWDDLRSDPRFIKLMRRMNFE